MQLRYDQLVLTGIAGLIGLTVVFACGVERGKQLVRSERMLLARHQPIEPPPVAVRRAERAPEAADHQATSAVPVAKPEGAAQSEKKTAPAPATTKLKEQKKLASASSAMTSSREGRSSRYAIQVVTYTRPQLAKKELDRLKARGERAFLVMRQGRTMVYVGPFPSKGNASEKLTALRSRYRDCFLKTL